MYYLTLLRQWIYHRPSKLFAHNLSGSVSEDAIHRRDMKSPKFFDALTPARIVRAKDDAAHIRKPCHALDVIPFVVADFFQRTIRDIDDSNCLSAFDLLIVSHAASENLAIRRPGNGSAEVECLGKRSQLPLIATISVRDKPGRF